MIRQTFLALVVCLLPHAAFAADDAGIEFFEKKIRPVLVRECSECHSSKAAEKGKLKGGLNLDSREAMLTGGDSGAAIEPGKPEESLLIEAMKYESFEMPPEGKLSAEIIADFEKWIEMDAPDPRKTDAVPKTQKAGIDFEAGRQHWAFQPPAKSSPEIKSPWITRKIDRFVLAGLQDENLQPAAPATDSVWLRRVTFDLTGLPPTPEDVETFANDQSAERKQKVVERLLASPHYGEHWAKFWLDIARYAEDQAHIVGNNKSLFYPNAWRYRDWVINAFNQDMPYDQFLELQLATDLIDPKDTANQVALGFIGVGPKYYRRNSPEVMADEWEDRVDVVSRGLMGLTVACARCHDHKYDPIETEDYYALAGVFASTTMVNQPMAGLDKEMAKKPEGAIHIIKEASPQDLPVYIRGDVKNKGPIVKRRFLQVLDAEQTPFEKGSGRLELAKAITDPTNPLTARVIVNRVWAQFFGQPLVGTPSNFGTLGDKPTHPKLLDDLAVRFMENGWSLKWLQREIVLASTYGQSSQGSPQAMAADPANTLLARMTRKRLDVEQWRDAILAVAGTLDENVGGQSIKPDDPKVRKRTVYSAISRLELNRMLALFDHPDPNTHSASRVETTTPLQKLFALNSPFMEYQSGKFADRLLDQPTLEERIETGYQLAFGRSPSEAEQQLAGRFFGEESESRELWVQYAQVLLASNEFFFLD